MATTKKERKTISELASRLQVLEEENRVLKIDIRLINDTLIHIQSILNEEVEIPEQEEEADGMPSKFSEFVRDNIQRLISDAVIEDYDDFAERIGLDPWTLKTKADKSASNAQLIEMSRLFGISYETFERYIESPNKMESYKAVCEAARKSEQECPDDPFSWVWFGFDRLGKNSKQLQKDIMEIFSKSRTWGLYLLNDPQKFNPSVKTVSILAKYLNVPVDKLIPCEEEKQ